MIEKEKIPATTLLMALDVPRDEILNLFHDKNKIEIIDKNKFKTKFIAKNYKNSN